MRMRVQLDREELAEALPEFTLDEALNYSAVMLMLDCLTHEQVTGLTFTEDPGECVITYRGDADVIAHFHGLLGDIPDLRVLDYEAEANRKIAEWADRQRDLAGHRNCEAEQQFCKGALVLFRTEGAELEARVITYRPDLGGYVVAATGLDESTVIPGEQWLALPSELTSVMWGE